MPAHLNPDAPLHGVWRRTNQRRVQNAIFTDRAALLFHLEREQLTRLSRWCREKQVTRSRYLCDLIAKQLDIEDPPTEEPSPSSEAVLADLDFNVV
jgi:hypothetical protein